MTAHPKPQPSFSPGRRWKIGFDVAVRTALMATVVVMINYLGGVFPERFYLSSQTRIKISPRTVDVLRSVTNRVAVTLYYDTQDDLYPTILSLLNAYHAVNPNISIRSVDYVRDAGEAEKIKTQYKLNAPTDKNLIIFDSGAGRLPKIVPGDALAKYTLERVPNEKEREFRKKPVAFLGEMMFTSTLLTLENSKPFTAYFLQGHGEPSPTDSGDTGYLKFAAVLAQNYVQLKPLVLLGDNPVPDDCDLLIVAGPRTLFSNPELQKIDQYLSQGGRLLLLLDYSSVQHPTGLEDILRHWGVNVGTDVVQDPKYTYSGQDVIVYNFTQHPVVNPLTGLWLELILPRPVGRINWQNPPADAPTVDELAFSGPDSVLMNEHGLPPHSYPLMAAVIQNEVKGLATAHGGCRIVVVGDSLFLSNRVIDGGANRDFTGYAVNWLLDRPTLLKGVGPRPVVEFRLMMTRQQQHQVRWLLLGALPGGVLALGGLVWLRRRK
ncbi:MAG TPA: GldG family protein [Verrucomicrobiae bacterium]|nr:GldG family protein [Verrucomicrobiae bacterium]